MGAAETERNPQRAAGAGPGENGRPQTESRQAGQRSGRDEALRRQAAAGGAYQRTASAGWLWKSPQTSVRYSGRRPLRPQRISMPKSPFGMAARQPLGAGAGLAGAGEALPHAGEGTAADPMLEFEQLPFKPQPLGANHLARRGEGRTRLGGGDARGDDERRGAPLEERFDLEFEGRAGPCGPVAGAAAAVAADACGIAEAGQVVGQGERRREILGAVAKRLFHGAKIADRGLSRCAGRIFFARDASFFGFIRYICSRRFGSDAPFRRRG